MRGSLPNQAASGPDGSAIMARDSRPDPGEPHMKNTARRLAALAALAIAATTLMPGPAQATPAPGVPNWPLFYAEVINRDTGKCMNLDHGSSDEGTKIQQYHCDRTPAAKFVFRDH